MAGVQDKLSPSVISFPFATRGQRWLLKLNPSDKPPLVENESFFMTMTAACGLEVAKTHLVKDRDGASGLLVSRFDRRREGRQWRGVHQEDACQFLPSRIIKHHNRLLTNPTPSCSNRLSLIQPQVQRSLRLRSPAACMHSYM